MVKQIAVYCASSSQIDKEFKEDAFRLGEIMADAGVKVKFGSGSIGLMGALARGVLSKEGVIIGVIPQFMVDEGWGNDTVSQQIVTHTMHERKKILMEDVDAVVALPGGCGTLEELLEAITWKQLGLFSRPIIIVNTNHFYDDLLKMMKHAVSEKFMRNEHLNMWVVVDSVEDVLPAIKNASNWSLSARKYASI